MMRRLHQPCREPPETGWHGLPPHPRLAAGPNICFHRAPVHCNWITKTMPKILAKLFILFLALPAFALAADCTAPEPPGELPDGKTASKEAMIEGQKAVQSYVREGDAYVACMDEAAEGLASELKALDQSEDVDPQVRQEREAKLDEVVEDRNEVVAQMKRIADGFNKEIDEFQARGSDGS